MSEELLGPSALAAAEAAAVAALAGAAAKARTEETASLAAAEASALENLAKAAAGAREVPRPPKAAPPSQHRPMPPKHAPTQQERKQVMQAHLKKGPQQPEKPPPRHVVARLIGAKVGSAQEMAMVSSLPPKRLWPTSNGKPQATGMRRVSGTHGSSAHLPWQRIKEEATWSS